MADNLVGVSIDNLPQVLDLVRKLPEEAQDAAGTAAAEYLVEKFKAYPPKKSVTRTEAYGFPFFTDKQRRWFFANLNEGTLQIPYNRTQGLRNSWQIIGRGLDKIVVSESSAAPWTMGDETQSRHEKLVGWKRVGDIITENAERLAKRMSGAIDKAMKKLGAR